MTLSQTDARILEILREGRNVSRNISDRLDQHPNYVSKRLSKLADEGIVTRVGAETVGLYELSERGERVLERHVALREELEAA